METANLDASAWARERVRPDEIERHLGPDGADFIDEGAIAQALAGARAPGEARLAALLEKSLSLRDLDLDEMAELMAVGDPLQRRRMDEAALAVKQRVFGRSVSTYAALYLGDACVNSCSYCGFKACRAGESRRVLNEAEIRAEVELLVGQAGHRHLLAVVGEHPSTGPRYIADALAAMAAVQAPRAGGYAQVRCLSLNAPPMAVDEFKAVRAAGLASYQVHQASYHRGAYAAAHPVGPKADFRWRLYAQHRAMEAGITHVGLGVLAGLADWRFEALALRLHAGALEDRFGMGPSGIRLQRLDSGLGEDEFLRLLVVLRLGLPTVGLTVDSAEGAELRRRALRRGLTLTDAAPSVAQGAFHDGGLIAASSCRPTDPGAGLTLEGLVRDLAVDGALISFHAPSLACPGVGPDFMALLRAGALARICRLDSILTFKEWLADYSDPAACPEAVAVLAREWEASAQEDPDSRAALADYCHRLDGGERGLLF